MILIHTVEKSSRLAYIVDFVFVEIFRSEVKLTTSIEEFESYKGVKLAYGDKALSDSLFLKKDTSILFENGIIPQKIKFKEWENTRVFFEVNEGVLPFDFFSAAFFLLSRYEEYLPQIKDHHRRYQHTSSVAFKGDFLAHPVINIWAEKLKRIILAHYPDYVFKELPFQFTCSIDIDNAYAYKHKGALKNIAKMMLSLFTFKGSDFWERFKVIAGIENDPFDSYDRMEQVHAKYNIKALFFILLGRNSKYDRALSYKNQNFRELILRLKESGCVGLHPSYASSTSFDMLRTEKQRLDEITAQDIVKSRQHYIKLSFPETYRNLIKLGIEADFSMGYPSCSGFRASTCCPFYFFDLEKNITTGLKVYPFIFMDTTMKVYLRTRSKEVLNHVAPMIEEVKKLGGHLIFIFHNESIGGKKKWKNWVNIYEDIIKLLLKN